MKRLLAFTASLAALVTAYTLMVTAAIPTVPSNQWVPAAELGEVRAGASATLLADGRVLVAGGMGETGAVSTAERYAPEGGTFIAAAPMQSARANHTATLLANGTVLVVGGTDTAGQATAAAELYDPAINAWLPAGSLNMARRGHTATRLPDGRVLVAGGDSGAALDSIEIFDPGTLQFTPAGTMTAARTQHAAASLLDGRVVIAGGNDGSAALASTDIFNPADDTVTPGPAMGAARSGLSATTLLDGTVLFAGGSDGTTELASADVLDATGSAFSAPDNGLSVARQNHTALLLPHNNQVLIVGGLAGGNTVASAEYFTPWEGVNGAFCATAICASGYEGPAVPATARAWAAATALSVPADTDVRTGPADGLALVAGGTGIHSADLFGFATVKTDKEDYAPGTTVTITGDGWQPGEWVALVLQEAPALDEHPLELVQADSNGHIVSTEFVPDEHDIGIRFYLTAYGVASQAQTTFRDGVATSMTVTASPTPSTFGQSVTFTATVICTAGPCTFNASHVVEFRDGGNGCSQGTVLASNIAVTVINSTSAAATYSTSALTPGSHTVRACFSGLNSAGFPNGANGTVSHVVGKTNPTLSVANSPQTYDATPKVAVVTSPVAGTVSDVRYNGSTTVPITAGTYSVTADFTPTNTTNYNTLNDASAGSFTVGQATSTTTVTVANAAYDTAAHGGSAVVTGAGGLNQALTVTYAGRNGTTYGPSTTAPTDAGDYTASASFAGDTNHAGSADSKDFSIARAAVVVTVTASNATYDGAAHGATATVTGVGGLNQSVPIEYTGLVYGTTAYQASAAPTEAGTYTATATFNGDANHASGSNSANFTIGKAATTVVVSAADASYDGNPHGATATVTGANGLNAPVAIEYSGLVYGSVPYLDSAAPTDAGSYTATANYAATGNYEGSSDQKSFVIGKAATTILLTASDAVYDNSPHGGTATVTGPNGLNAAVDVTYTGMVYGSIPYVNTASPTEVGTYTVTATYAGTGNYETSTESKAFAITKATSTTVVTVNNAVYDGTAHGGSAAVTGAGNLSDTVAVIYSGRNTTVYSSSAPPTNAGDYTASATYAGDNNHTGSTDAKDFSIEKADAVLSVTGYTGTYDASAHGATGTATGVGGADLSAGLSLGASFTDVPGSTAHWTFTGGTNYNDASGDVAIVINKANAVIDVSGYTGVYDAAPHGASGTATGVGGVNLTAGLNLGATFTDVPGGTAHWTFAGGTNYKDASGDAAIVINKADATVSVSGYTGTYDATPHGASGTATGVGGVNLIAGLSLGATFTDVPGGTAHWTFAGGTNYNDASGDVAITINKATAVINVNGYTGVYDAAAHGATGTATGIGGVNLTAGLNLGATFTDVPGGTAHWTFAGGTNYKDASGDAAIVINKADATVSVSGYTGTYDATPHGASGTATGVGGADLSAGLNMGATFTDVPGGTANWSFTGGTNYNNTDGSVAIVISKATATVTVNGYSGPYDGNAHGATGTAAGVGGSVISGLDLGASFTDVPGGTANWSFANPNYVSQNGSVNVNITPATATVTVNGYSGTYDGNAHGATGTATGVNGTDLSAGLNLGATFTDVPGGTAHWTFDGGINYNDASSNVAIVIGKADATINVAGYTGTFDNNAHGATGSATGVNGADLSAGLTLGASFTNVPGGTAHWTFAGGINHNDASGDVAISITPATATVTVNGYTGVYDGSAHGAALVSAVGVGGANLTASVTLGGQTFTNVPGGVATWSFTNANYVGQSGSATITITPANAAIVVTGYNVVWDGVEHVATGTATGVLSEPLTGLNLTATKRTAVGTSTDPWTFVAPNANYNGASGTVTNTISGWTENGYFAPVDMTPASSAIVWNTVKGGSTVPLKFEIFAGGVEKTTTAAVAGFVVNQVSCSNGYEDPIDIALTTTGGTALRYDGTSGFFIQNWQTPKAPGKCYQVVMTAQDGSQITRGFFKLK